MEEVYRLEDILNESELESLTASADQLMIEFDTLEKIESGIKGKKFTEILAVALRQQLRAVDQQKVAIAIYLESIVKFLNMRSNDFAHGLKALPWFVPIGLKHKVFNSFMEEG